MHRESNDKSRRRGEFLTGGLGIKLDCTMDGCGDESARLLESGGIVRLRTAHTRGRRSQSRRRRGSVIEEAED